MLKNLVCIFRKAGEADDDDSFTPISRMPSYPRSRVSGLAAAKVLKTEQIPELMLADMFTVDNNALNKISAYMSSFMAAKFGEVAPGVISPIGITEPGKIRSNLADTYQVTNNYIEAQAKIDGAATLSQLRTELNRVSKNNRISHRVTNELFDELVETMAFDAETKNPITLKVIGQRQERLQDRLESMGIDPADINALKTIARQYTEINNNVRRAALPYINETPELKNIGYIPRIWTPQGAMWLQKKLGVPRKEVTHMTGEQLLQSIHMRERDNISFTYIPVEENLELLMRFYDTPTVKERLAKNGLTMPTKDEFIDMAINDPLRYRNFLQKTLTKGNLEKLSNTGVLEILPMTSREVFEFLVDSFELPFKHLSYYMKTDPTSLTSAYASSLAKAAGRSATFDYIKTYGVANGFAVSYPAFDPIKHAGWVNAGKPDFWKNILDSEHIPQKFEVWLHPVAAEQLKSLVSITTSPAQMSNLAYLAQTAGKLISKTIISQIGYPFALTSVVGNAFVSAWATGSPLAIATYAAKSLPQSWRLLTLGSNGFNELIKDRPGLAKYLSLDDERPYITVGGQPYTEAAAVQRLLFFRSGELGAIGASLDTSGFKGEYWKQLFAIGDVKSALAYANAMQVGKAKGKAITPGEWLGDFLEMNTANLNQSLDKIIAPLIFFNNLSDFATRLTVLKHAAGSLGITNKWNFDSWQDLMNYTDGYAYSGNRQGSMVRELSRYGWPFLGFMFWAPPAAVRNLIRHPSKYMAYQHLIRLTSQHSAFGDDDSDREFVLREYQREGTTVGIARDPRGQPIIWNASSTDPMLGGLRSIEQLVAPSENKFADTVDAILGRSYYRIPYELISGRDSFTNTVFEELGDTSLLWLELPGATGQRVRRILSAIPFVDAVDRLNPLGIWGTAPLRDYTGKLIRQEQLGLFGNQRFSSLDRKLDDITLETPFVWFARHGLGLNLQVVDTAANLNYNLRDMQKELELLQSTFDRATRQYNSVYTQLPLHEQEARKKELVKMNLKMFEYQRTMLFIEGWAAHRGIATGEALNTIRRLRSMKERAANGLEAYPEIEAVRKLLETYNLNQEKIPNVQKDANSEP